MQSCKPTMHHQALRPISSTGTHSLFKNFLYLPVGNFSLPIFLRMISQIHYMFYSIFVHEFLKHHVCKVAPSITNNSPRCLKSTQDISL